MYVSLSSLLVGLPYTYKHPEATTNNGSTTTAGLNCKLGQATRQEHHLHHLNFKWLNANLKIYISILNTDIKFS